jgi:DNA-binding transcriptional LysR family regulator
MDLRHLRYFVAVAEEMHFGRAAARLGVSQPPLSQQIKALEEELGVLLLERTSRRVRLTEAGRMFLEEARQTLVQAERSMRVARRAHRGELGQVRLAFTASAPFVPAFSGGLREFRSAFPLVDLTLEENGRDEQIQRLERQQLEIGISRGFGPPILPDDLVGSRFLEEEMMLAVRADHPFAQRQRVSIADLAGEPLVMYGAATGSGFNEHFFTLCESHGFRANVAFEAGSFATLLGLVIAGFGATVLSRSLARLHVGQLAYRALAEPVTTSLWMVHRRTPTATAQAFIEILERAARSGSNV